MITELENQRLLQLKYKELLRNTNQRIGLLALKPSTNPSDEHEKTFIGVDFGPTPPTVCLISINQGRVRVRESIG